MVNHVVVLGSINVDTTYHVNRFPLRRVRVQLPVAKGLIKP